MFHHNYQGNKGNASHIQSCSVLAEVHHSTEVLRQRANDEESQTFPSSSVENLLNNDGDNFSGAEVALEFAQDTACVGSSNTATDLPGVHNSNSGNKNAIV